MNRIILLNVNDPQDGFGHTVVGVVEMTKELAQLILTRAKIAKEQFNKDDQFNRIEFYSRCVSYFEYSDELDTEMCETLASDNHAEVEENPFRPAAEENTEYDVMALDVTHVWWRTSSKHSEVMATTSPVAYELLEKFLV